MSKFIPFTRTFSILTASCALLLAQNLQADGDPVVSISPTHVTVDSDGGRYVILLISDIDWVLEGLPNWITLSQTSGGPAHWRDPDRIELVFEANPSTSERSSTFTIGGEEHTLVQHGAEPGSIFRDGVGTADLEDRPTWTAFGYLYDDHYPLVYASATDNWLFVSGDSEASYFVWDYSAIHWAYTGLQLYPYRYIMTGENAGTWSVATRDLNADSRDTPGD